ncbi:MAG: cupin domain-containing protein [Chloroflexota bacterium]|nr:cupin domain-containing protein [Chloroflexota bacterium]
MAQDAAPPHIEPLGVADPSGAPGMIVVLNRLTFPEGGGAPSYTHPGATLVYVESGAFAVTLLEGAGVMTRAAVDGTPGPVEELEIGMELILGPGDTFFEDVGTIHISRNAADGDTVVITTQLLEAGAPSLIPATPIG